MCFFSSALCLAAFYLARCDFSAFTPSNRREINLVLACFDSPPLLWLTRRGSFRLFMHPFRVNRMGMHVFCDKAVKVFFTGAYLSTVVQSYIANNRMGVVSVQHHINTPARSVSLYLYSSSCHI